MVIVLLRDFTQKASLCFYRVERNVYHLVVGFDRVIYGATLDRKKMTIRRFSIEQALMEFINVGFLSRVIVIRFLSHLTELTVRVLTPPSSP